MEALAVLGIGAYMAQDLFGSKKKTVDIAASDAQLAKTMIETPEQMVLHEAKYGGIIAPQYQFAAARVPWDSNNPPYPIHRIGQFPQHATPSDLYQYYVNAIGHQRHDAVEAMAANQPQFARFRGQPMWGAYTAELHEKDDPTRRTQHMQWSWLPRNANDTDYADAGALAKAVPPDPNLWTPDGWWATAPGLPWRYSY